MPELRLIIMFRYVCLTCCRWLRHRIYCYSSVLPFRLPSSLFTVTATPMPTMLPHLLARLVAAITPPDAMPPVVVMVASPAFAPYSSFPHYLYCSSFPFLIVVAIFARH